MKADTMQALVLTAYGEDYQLQQVTRPVAQKGEVLVQIKASSVNPLDLKIKEGAAAHARTTLPTILGIDMAGVVVAVGKEVTSFKPGDEVFGMTGGIGGVQGSLAQYAAVDANLLAHKPANSTFKEAAALPLAFITAWEGLVDRANINKDKTVLIQGGNGGVGHIAIQIAKSFGAVVYATGSAGQQEVIEGYGAIFLDYTKLAAADMVNLYTRGEGFDIVFDTVGGATLDASFTMPKIYTGHVISILGWGTHSLAPLSFRGATYSGVFTLMPLLTGKGRKHHGEILEQAARLLKTGQLHPVVETTPYTLQTIAQAYTAIQNREAKGKVVIDILS